MKILFFDSSLHKFIKSLETTSIAKTLRTIDLLEKFGNKLALPHSKKVAAGIFELRVHGSQNIRIFYTFHQNTPVLLYGFVKKTNKIPLKEISFANKKKNLLAGK